MWSLKFQEWNAKGLNQHSLPHPQYMEVGIRDGVLQDDAPETSLPILASRPVSFFLTFHPKPAESPWWFLHTLIEGFVFFLKALF